MLHLILNSCWNIILSSPEWIGKYVWEGVLKDSDACWSAGNFEPESSFWPNIWNFTYLWINSGRRWYWVDPNWVSSRSAPCMAWTLVCVSHLECSEVFIALDLAVNWFAHGFMHFRFVVHKCLQEPLSGIVFADFWKCNLSPSDPFACFLILLVDLYSIDWLILIKVLSHHRILCHRSSGPQWRWLSVWSKGRCIGQVCGCMLSIVE